MVGLAVSIGIGTFLVIVIALDITTLFLVGIAVVALLYSVHCTTWICEIRLLFPDLRMDTQAYDLLMVMRNGDVAVETKASLIGTLKSDIKNRHVPENAVPYIFDICRNGVTSAHSSLSGAGLTTLGYLLKRLYLQDQAHIVAAQAPKTLPVLMDRLGDHREKLRDLAAQAFTDFWIAAPVEVEQVVLDGGLTSKSSKTKERCLTWLAYMGKEKGLLFRSYVPKVVGCLEDADGGVRETAKATVIELFVNAPDRAKADLKKQLQLRNVRKSIATAILSQLGMPNLIEHEMKSSTSSRSKPDILQLDSAISMSFDDPQRPASVASFHSQNSVDMSRKDTGAALHTYSRSDTTKEKVVNSFPHPKGETPRKDATLSASIVDDIPPPVSSALDDGEKVEPAYVSSAREFDETVRDMQPHFEGKETEGNWMAREKSVVKLRRLTRGNAPQDFSHSYIAGIKLLLDGILKTVNSLRTTVSAVGCSLIQDVARTAGPGIDAMVEILLQSLIKLCGGTKKISAQNGNITVDAIVGNVSYNVRLLHHLWNACQDKNVQPRLYTAGWLKTLIVKHGRHKSSIEHSGGLEITEKCIKKGLADANPGVRENMRGTYWTFAKLWPDKAEVIMSNLDSKSQGLLEKDSGNPNHIASSTSSRPALSQSVTTGPPRPSLKETIAAQKKAKLAAKDLPARPESAQSSFSEFKPSNTPKINRPLVTASATTRAVPSTAATFGHTAGSLSSAPMRPPMRPPRRPELMRPATADPYASRRMLISDGSSKTSSPTETPMKARPKTATTPAAKMPSPIKPRLKKPSPSTSPVKVKTSRPDAADARPMATPALKGNSMRFIETDVDRESPVGHHEDFTMVMPNMRILADLEPPSKKKEVALSPEKMLKSSVTNNGSIGKHSPSASDDFSNAETLKVYEDPLPITINEVQSTSAKADRYKTPRADTKVKALEELPVNEPATLPLRPFEFPDEREVLSPLHGSGTNPGENTHRRWNKVEAAEKRKSISPRSKDPEQARHMLDNGINKIRAKNLDVHGYRKLQGLIKEHDNIFKDEGKFDDLLLALLDSLEAPNEERRTALGRPMDLKTQVLVTTRLMFAHNKKYFSAYYPRAMSAIISARKYYNAQDHIVSGLEETSEDIAAACDPGDVINAILDVLETEERTDEGCRSIAMGIYVLTGLLHRLNKRNMTMDQPEIERLGKLAFRCIRDTHPDIRRAVIDYCLELRDMVEPEERFWRLINDSVEDYRALLTYYIVRRPSRV